MVLTKDEFVTSLKEEIRILLHLIGKVDPAKVDFRPTPKQRSILELLQYLAIQTPTQITVFKNGVFTRAAMMAAWGPVQEAAKNYSLQQCVAAIEKQGAEFDTIFSPWKDADFREPLNMFGNQKTRGFFMVNVVISSLAAYRMQLFGYLKLC